MSDRAHDTAATGPEPEVPLDISDYEGVCTRCDAAVENHGSGWFHVDGRERDHRAQVSR